MIAIPPPLSLYIHIPWCIQKCPYCDFNSHALKETLPEQAYITHLLNDLAQTVEQHPYLMQRPLHSIFIGGGTPSLLSGQAITLLLEGVNKYFPLSPSLEITLEANPGAVDRHHFAAYRAAGVNRISLGIQSFNDQHLAKLGRIHSSHEARDAVALVHQLGFPEVNIDIMHGLPQQSITDALTDLEIAIKLQPSHFSWYQLTIEPNTLFASRPPTLPDDDLLWSIYNEGQHRLSDAGYQQYEVSAYASAQHYCAHNLNYWRFGDYIGIGCGAHGKLTDPQGNILRTVKTRHPKGYLAGQYQFSTHLVALSERPFEFFMNRFRLFEAIPRDSFSRCTGLAESVIQPAMQQAIKQGLLVQTATTWETTAQGRLFLNSLLELFLTD